MLKILKLENFRNHLRLELELGAITVLIGQNGAGKSNVLEAVSMLSFCRSFREEDKKNLVNYDCSFARVTGDEIEIFVQREPMLLVRPKVKGVPRRQSNFVGTIKSVVFSPETLALITGSPRTRRKFQDIAISQRDHDYLRALIAFEKVRKERNSLLSLISEGRSRSDELDFWDQELVKSGEEIIRKRAEMVAILNEILPLAYKDISGKDQSFKIEYVCNAEDHYKELLAQSRQKDIYTRSTQIGPHRDDLCFLLDSRDMANFASRGEIRSAILALKMGELEFLTDEGGEKPILLLDDVFSEFDAARRARLCTLILDHQAVITTTDESHLTNEVLERAKIIRL